jgi:hypothetical protein
MYGEPIKVLFTGDVDLSYCGPGDLIEYRATFADGILRGLRRLPPRPQEAE